jgi:hypothetical protein
MAAGRRAPAWRGVAEEQDRKLRRVDGGRCHRGVAGFHATAGLLALVTAILGATAGANLIVLALDIRRDRACANRPRSRHPS